MAHKIGGFRIGLLATAREKKKWCNFKRNICDCARHRHRLVKWQQCYESAFTTTAYALPEFAANCVHSMLLFSRAPFQTSLNRSGSRSGSTQFCKVDKEMVSMPSTLPANRRDHR